MTTAAAVVATTVAAVALPAPRRKTRVREVPGVAVPLPSALQRPPFTHYEATYSQGHIFLRDPRQAAALWHNGCYGHGLQGGGGGGGGGSQRKKKWRLVEAEGVRDGEWFANRREEEEKWRKRGGMEERREEDEEEMEEEERDLAEENRRNEERMNWEEEEEEMEEEKKEDEEEEEEGKEEGREAENKTTKEEEEEEREKATDDTTDTDVMNRNVEENKNDIERNTTAWRTVLTLSADQEATKADIQGPNSYLTLLPEEALFLSYVLGCLVLTYEDPPTARKQGGKRALTEDTDTHEMTIDEMWRVFVADDVTFPVKYAAYHHFRCEGWVVKAGLKYGVDYVLYPVGPPFFHSQYAVRVQSLWADTLKLDQSLPGHEMTWTTVATTERLTNHINKTPVLCFILRPRATAIQGLSHIECLKELKVQTVVLGRWNPCDGSG